MFLFITKAALHILWGFQSQKFTSVRPILFTVKITMHHFLSVCWFNKPQFLKTFLPLILEFYSCMKFCVSFIRVLSAIIVVYLFSCTNKFFLFFSLCIFVYQYIFLFFIVYFVYFSCINVKAYFVLSAIYYIQSLKSRQNFLKIK